MLSRGLCCSPSGCRAGLGGPPLAVRKQRRRPRPTCARAGAEEGRESGGEGGGSTNLLSTTIRWGSQHTFSFSVVITERESAAAETGPARARRAGESSSSCRCSCGRWVMTRCRRAWRAPRSGPRARPSACPRSSRLAPRLVAGRLRRCALPAVLAPAARGAQGPFAPLPQPPAAQERDTPSIWGARCCRGL